jgi:hypothetical protein
MGETLDHFGESLGWNRLPKWNQCRQQYGIEKLNSASSSYKTVEPNTPEWYNLARKNRFDMELFRHARSLFENRKA